MNDNDGEQTCRNGFWSPPSSSMQHSADVFFRQ